VLEREENRNSTHAEPPEFLALIEELEDFTGRRVRGEARSLFLEEFAKSPGGFARCLRSALHRARLNPIGLLVTMIRDGEHLLKGRARVDDRARMRDAGSTPPPVAVCLHCETGGGLHVDGCPEATAA
jgi:hypothetical protein